MSKLVSFVIPSYNCAAFLPHAVKSALDQSYSNVEVIIVDDASTDRTRQYTKWITENDKRVHVINNEKNKGRSESRNIGNRIAFGEYLFVLDSDDIAHPRRVELCMKRLERFQFVHGMGEIIDSCGRIVAPLGTEVFRKDRAMRDGVTGIFHSSVAYHKDFAIKYPYQGGDICKLGIDDWQQQMAAALAGVKFEYIPILLSYYRHWDGGISQNRDKDEVVKAKGEALKSMGVCVGTL